MMTGFAVGLSAQLPRLTSTRAKLIDSQELALYLNSLHQDFRTWMDALGRFFANPKANRLSFHSKV